MALENFIGATTGGRGVLGRGRGVARGGRAVVSGGRFQSGPARSREANQVAGDASEQLVGPVQQSPEYAFSVEQRAGQVIQGGLLFSFTLSRSHSTTQTI